MLVSMSARPALLKVRASCCTSLALLLEWLVKPGFLRTFRTQSTSVYVKSKQKITVNIIINRKKNP